MICNVLQAVPHYFVTYMHCGVKITSTTLGASRVVPGIFHRQPADREIEPPADGAAE
uniref:Uncharacterized protein n=1 Tax=Rhizophagus irregularis (strain DAOM 181602 / DAOM 197198 / MUCL 43194) TaxID=747089 RepID=U9USH1_RHIID